MSDAAPKSGLSVYLRLLKYVIPYWRWFAISILGHLCFALAQPLFGGMLKYFVDGLSHPDAVLFPNAPWPWLARQPLLYAVPVSLALIALLQGIGFFLGNYFLALVSRSLVNNLRVQLFNNLLTLPNPYFDQHNSGRLISRITYDVTMVTSAATSAVKVVIREGMTVIFLFGALLYMHWKLTLVMLAILPFISLMVTGASRRFRRLSRRIQETMGNLTHVASETIQSYRVVRSFGGESYERGRFEAASRDNMKKELKSVLVSSIYTPSLQVVVFSTMAVLLYLILLMRGDATVGDLVAYITIAALLPKPIRQLSETSPDIQRGIAGAESIFSQLDEKPEPDSGTLERAAVSGHLEIRNLSFTYPGGERSVLDNVSFRIEPGQMVALVGRSGSGKSTLASLIPRFYDYEQGEIFLDGAEIRDYRLQNLRRHIALVTQQVNLFNDTILNNIAYGDLSGKSEAETREAAGAAFALEFIERLPEGFQTQVGENGVMLSGGQRQRLAIARALLKNAPILILDEATSALDTESERAIQSALEKLMAGRTTLVIAHRLSTIERADLILVMDEGRIVERGIHAELLARNGHYARLHARQSEKERDGKTDVLESKPS